MSTPTPIKVTLVQGPKESTLFVCERPNPEFEVPELAVCDFGPRYDPSTVELALVIDCTSSMADFIEKIKIDIKNICSDVKVTGNADLKLGLVKFRDHKAAEETFVTETSDFTDSIDEMSDKLGECNSDGVSNGPKAVADGLNEALNLTWSEDTTKICILITDAPPHGLISEDDFPEGSPEGHDPLVIAKEMSKKGIALYTIGSEPGIEKVSEFYSALTFRGCGQYIPVKNSDLLREIIASCCIEEISLERLMPDMQRTIDDQIANGITDKGALIDEAIERLEGESAPSRQCRLNDCKIEGPGEEAMGLSKLDSMEEMRSNFKAKTYLKSDIIICKRKPLPTLLPSGEVVEAVEEPEPASKEDKFKLIHSIVIAEQIERLVFKAINRSA